MSIIMNVDNVSIDTRTMTTNCAIAHQLQFGILLTFHAIQIAVATGYCICVLLCHYWTWQRGSSWFTNSRPSHLVTRRSVMSASSDWYLKQSLTLEITFKCNPSCRARNSFVVSIWRLTYLRVLARSSLSSRRFWNISFIASFLLKAPNFSMIAFCRCVHL